MQRDDYERYMTQTLKLAGAVKSAKNIPPEIKQKILKHASDLIAQKVYVDGFNESEFKNAKIFSEMALSLLADDASAVKLLQSLSEHSDTLYAHAVATSIYSVVIANQLGRVFCFLLVV
jgi:HD-GYP domain-containing protein (c-di-GMP phosphodiesterase class II)